jgi:hypothetical protein
MSVHDNSAASQQIKNEAQPQRTISDVLAKKENPETAATGSGTRVKHLSDVNGTSCDTSEQQQFRGGAKI